MPLGIKLAPMTGALESPFHPGDRATEMRANRRHGADPRGGRCDEQPAVGQKYLPAARKFFGSADLKSRRGAENDVGNQKPERADSH